MKVVGIIKMVEFDRQGTTKQGKPFESHRVFFEGGGDAHMVDVFLTLGDGVKAQDILNRRGLVANAIGEMEMKYTVDSYNGKWFRRCEFVGFRIPQQPTQAQVPGTGASQEEVAAGMAEAAAEHEAAIAAAQPAPEQVEGKDKLPF